MALDLTAIDNYVNRTEEFSKNMSRPSRVGALDFFASQTTSPNTWITQELINAARNSAGKQLQIPALDWGGNREVGNVRLCTIPLRHNTSRLVNVLFVDFVDSFTTIPTLHNNNYISYQEDFNRKMSDTMNALRRALDIAALTSLETNKSQVFVDQLGMDISADGALVSRNWANMLGNIYPVMGANDYNGNVHVIGNTGIEAQLMHLAQLGANNSINKVLELAGLQFHFTNNLLNEDDPVSGNPFFGTGFAVEDGNVGVLTVGGREHLRGMSVNGKEKTTYFIPEIGLPIDYYTYRDVLDVSQVVNQPDMTCNEVTFHQFAVSVAFVSAVNTHPEEVPNPIFKFALTEPSAAIPTTAMPRS